MTNAKSRSTYKDLTIQAIDDPSSNLDPPTYTHQPSMQQKVPV